MHYYTFNNGTAGNNVANIHLNNGVVSGTPPVYSTTKWEGALGVVVNAAASNTSMIIATPTVSGNKMRFRGYIRFSTLPSVGMHLVQIRHAGGNAAVFGLSNTNRFVAQNAPGTTVSQSGILSVDTWYRIEFAVQAGTTTTDGVIRAAAYEGDSLTSIWLFESSEQNTNTAELTNVRFGKPHSAGALTNTYYDTITVASGSTVFFGPFAGELYPPVAVIQGPVIVDAGDEVTLSGSGSYDPDGTITAYSWSQASGPAVTFGSGTTSSITFDAPADINGSTLVFQLTVTDNSSYESYPVNYDVTAMPQLEWLFTSGGLKSMRSGND